MLEIEEMLLHLKSEDPKVRETAKTLLLNRQEDGSFPPQAALEWAKKFLKEDLILSHLVVVLARSKDETVYPFLKEIYRTHMDLLLLLSLLECFEMDMPAFEVEVVDRLVEKKKSLFSFSFQKSKEEPLFTQEELKEELLLPSLIALQKSLSLKNAIRLEGFFQHPDPLVRYQLMIAYDQNQIQIPPKWMALLQKDSHALNREQATYILERNNPTHPTTKNLK